MVLLFSFVTAYSAFTRRSDGCIDKHMASAGKKPLPNTAVSVGKGKAKTIAASSKACALRLPKANICVVATSCMNCRATRGGFAASRGGGLDFHLSRSRFSLKAMMIANAHAPGLLGSTPVVAQIVASRSVGGMGTGGMTSLLGARLPNVRFAFTVSRRASVGVRNFNKGSMLFLMSKRHLTNRALGGMSCSHLGLSGMRHVRVIGNTTSALCNSDTVKKIVGVVAHRSSSP